MLDAERQLGRVPQNPLSNRAKLPDFVRAAQVALAAGALSILAACDTSVTVETDGKPNNAVEVANPRENARDNRHADVSFDNSGRSYGFSLSLIQPTGEMPPYSVELVDDEGNVINAEDALQGKTMVSGELPEYMESFHTPRLNVWITDGNSVLLTKSTIPAKDEMFTQNQMLLANQPDQAEGN